MKYPKIKLKEEIDESEEIIVDTSKLVEFKEGCGGLYFGLESDEYITYRASGNLCRKAIYLPQKYDYVVGIDNEKAKCLLVMKKEE